jgi:RimJ/RimL family protein N-acetyltransferase
MQPATIETARLQLRPLTQDDQDAIYAVIGDDATMQYYPRGFTRRDAAEWVERNLRRYEQDGHGLMAVVVKGTGDVIGDCGLTYQLIEGVRLLEVGYHLRRDQWGHGYATEAAKACMDYAFRQLGARQVVSLIRPENLPSRRVAERNGLRTEREVQHAGLLHLLYVMNRESYGQT